VSWTEKPGKRWEGHFKVDIRNMPQVVRREGQRVEQFQECILTFGY